MVKKNSKNITDKNWCAALSYLFVGILWFALDDNMRKDSFVRFHAKQGLVLLIAVIALNMLSSLLPFLALVWWLLGLGLFVLGLLGFIFALDHKKKSIPILGSLAKNFKF